MNDDGFRAFTFFCTCILVAVILCYGASTYTEYAILKRCEEHSVYLTQDAMMQCLVARPKK